MRDALAVPARVAKRDLVGLGALQIELQIVLPGHADAAMQLDAGGADLAAGIGGGGLCHRDRERRIGFALIDRPGGVIGQRFGVLDLDQHVGAFVLDALIAADRLAEGDAHLA